MIIESLVQWLAVEEDLVSSYERLARELPDAVGREAAAKLCDQSRAEIPALSEFLAKFEGIDRERLQRIQTVSGLAK